MIRIKSERKIVQRTAFWHNYSWKDSDGGFSFPSDENGNVKVDWLMPQAAENYAKCMSGEFDVVDDGVNVESWSYVEPAIGECHCGAEVELEGFTCECDACGRAYNSAGQELSDPSTWGEETGEHPADVMRIR